MQLSELRKKIEEKSATIGVIGLGYVGLPVACTFAHAGFSVIGIDLKQDRVSLINSGRSPIEGEEPGLAELLAETVASGRMRAAAEYAELAKADVVLIDVETPVGADNVPAYVALRAACRSLGPVLAEGALVIVESTIAPGTIDTVVGPILASSTGRQVNNGFYLGACPERVMPGKLLANLRAMSRVCGGSTAETAEIMVALYRHIVEAELDTADPVTAELVKTTENAYRDVQIAFANEVALICEAAGGDVWRVRELVNKSPYRQMHLPGAGVGGHCIPKDPWLLAYGAGDKVEARLIPAARGVNESMPAHMFELTVGGLAQAGIPLNGARVAVMGYAYLENSDDTRHTPSEPLVKQLQAAGAQVSVHDPYVAGCQGDWQEVITGKDAVVFMVAHEAYRQLDLAQIAGLLKTPLLVDGRHIFEPAAVKAAGMISRCVGVAVTA